MSVTSQEKEKPFDEILLTPEEGAINVFPTSELAKLPKGIALNEGDYGTAVLRMGEILAQIEDELLEKRPDIPRRMGTSQPQNRLLETIEKQRYQPASRRIIETLIEKYPNLCWMRCGELKMEDGVGILEDTNLTDGWVGDPRVTEYAEKKHRGGKREVPALYMIRLKDMIQRYNEGFITIGAHHEGNISLGYRTDKETLSGWAEKHIKVFRMPKNKDEINSVKELLKEKAV